MPSVDTDFDIAPDEPASPLAIARVDAPLASVLPADFQLAALLQFLPDVRLKQHADAVAAEALAVDVTQPDGLALADTKLAQLREADSIITKCFEYPVDLAYQLHKRLTGLRADFRAEAGGALVTVGRRVVGETNVRKAAEAAAKRAAQEAADRQARQEAARAAQEAARANAAPQVVERLQEVARTAVAPPVASPAPVQPLATTSVVQRWKARVAGTPADAEPNPKVADLTPAQQDLARRLCAAIGQGLVALAAVELNWGYMNRRAAAEKTALSMPGIEAFDEGGTRSRGRR